jgi:hypothetical protein
LFCWGFYRAEGEAAGKILLWPNLDRILRWQTSEADFVLVKLKEGREVEYTARSILYEGGIFEATSGFHQLGA